MAGELEKLKEQRSLMAADALQGKVEELRLEELKKKQELSKRQRAIQAGGQKAAQEILKVAREELAELPKNGMPHWLCVEMRSFLTARVSM